MKIFILKIKSLIYQLLLVCWISNFWYPEHSRRQLKNMADHKGDQLINSIDGKLNTDIFFNVNTD